MRTCDRVRPLEAAFPLALVLAWASLAPPAAALCGDCNLDGIVTIIDVLNAAQSGVGIVTLGGVAFDNCDVWTPGGDGRVDILDGLAIARYAVGTLPSLSCVQGGGCPTATPDPSLLDTIISYTPGTLIDLGHADPVYAINGVIGGGCCAGSLDVCSLGSSGVGWGGELTLRLDGKLIVDGPGDDIVIYENAFHIGGAPENGGFYETGVVEVSLDGVSYVTFPIIYDDTYPVTDRRRYVDGFCGVEPVLFRTALGHTPGDPALGGDRFDLAEVGLCEIRFIRIRDTAQVYPDANFPPGDCDIDGIAVLYTAPDP